MVLVTGAGGFIGGRIVRLLAAGGRDVRAVVHERPLRPPQPDALGSVETIRADLAAGEFPAALFEEVGTVVHAAAILPGSRATRGTQAAEVEMRAMNARAPARLLEAAARAGAGRFIHVSSGGVLGATGDLPAGENFPPRPLSPYERTKWEGERDLIEAARRAGMPLAVLRPALVYGPGDSHLAGRLLAARRRFRVLLDGGRALCHPVHVDDVAAFAGLCVERPVPVEGVYHVAGERPVAWLEWLDAIASAAGARPISIPLPLGPVRAAASLLERAAGAIGRKSPLNRERLDSISVSHAFDISRAHRELGWTPRVPLASGLEEAIRAIPACRQAGFTASSPE